MKKEMKHFKGENAGRSMTEMLGVLAIIGVLSLGGIIGYKLAMNRYAANQIAYEINMMKTDAKVKIMQGNDALTLGQPYDGDSDYLGYLNYNEAYTVDFDCVWAGDKFIDEAETCQVANAYYIELQHIPEGICKPLANLIENMNDLIAFDINPKENGEVGEGGNCEEGENVLNAVFSAEPGDLEVLKCDPGECPTGFHCLKHLCVECIGHEDCTKGNAGICTENNTCDYCDEGEVRDENNNNNCVECTDDTHCPYKATAPHCDLATHTCGNCPNDTHWSDELSKCVPCTEDAHCLDKNTNPVCNKDTGECGPCPNEGEAWDKDQGTCAPVVCTTNAECFDHLNQNYYCDKEPINACGENETGTCKKFELDLHGSVNNVSLDGTAKIATTYWNVCRICEANAGQNGAKCSENDYSSPYMLTPDFLNCADKFDPSTDRAAWYCHETATGNRGFEENNISHNLQDLREFFGCPRLPDSSKGLCAVSPFLVVYNSSYPCDSYRIGLDDRSSQPDKWGDMGFCLETKTNGRMDRHRGMICKSPQP